MKASAAGGIKCWPWDYCLALMDHLDGMHRTLHSAAMGKGDDKESLFGL